MRLAILAAAALAVSGCAPPPDPRMTDIQQKFAETRVLLEQVKEKSALEAEIGRTAVPFALSANEEQEVRDLIRDKLKDPDSANFRSVVGKQGSGKRFVCGEVNARNSYGGFTGYKDFLVLYDVEGGTYSDIRGSVYCNPPL